MPSLFTEADVEAAALEWFAELGYAVAYGPTISPGEPTAERASYAEVVLVGRLRDAVDRLNPTLPAVVRDNAVGAGHRHSGCGHVLPGGSRGALQAGSARSAGAGRP